MGGGSGALRWVDSTLCCGDLHVDAGFLMPPALVFVGRELDRLVLRARVDHLGPLDFTQRESEWWFWFLLLALIHNTILPSRLVIWF